jgi:hypothetical protein
MSENFSRTDLIVACLLAALAGGWLLAYSLT